MLQSAQGGEASEMRTPTVPAVPVGGRRSDWLDHAACRGRDPELFFPVTDIGAARVQVEAAKKVCRRCPVQRACLSWALGNRQEAGIWGGMTEEERHRLRRRRRTPG
jgi:WhiB family transcriptional regulator, redox-sensing transcriptional regulator